MRTSQQPYDTHIGPILILLMELVLRLYAALSEQCPDAISTVPVQQGSVREATIAFDSIKAYKSMFSFWNRYGWLYHYWNTYLSASSSAYRLSLVKTSHLAS
ncbi:hypothetical protein G6F70_008497 [Rhizopus microsporus]|nr:hypothetical protein G6F71_007652 [Rhizopus microsporus]KAG1195098.1 hypothetical protein G6F70_008497 [Rhizopus microsporus]KAG1207418.1 hypothetical protein G6F69_008058 [Rhizopus microsporus]KAG1227567.1 hypothetical protein G6F67_008370 [Rhizopus microsporus]KAG1259385.1 hypothetical protein G6F68_008158 [Rhizopus microsporus]